MRLLLLFCFLSALVGSEAVAQRAPREVASPAPVAWLGVGFADATPGVVIDEVIPDSPADLAGVQTGDLVYAVDGVAVGTGVHFQELIKAHGVGDEVALKIRRGRTLLDTRAELTALLNDQELLARRLVDKEAPDFSLPPLSGSASGSLASHRGKVIVLYFWTTRCQNCTEQFASLAALQAEYLGEIEVLAITADAKSVVENFLQTYKLGVTVLHDPGFDAHHRYRYNKLLPTAVVIARDGYVRHADTGDNLRMDDIVKTARRALRERPSI